MGKPMGGVPNKESMRSFRFQPELDQALQKEAKRIGWSLTRLVTFYLEQAVGLKSSEGHETFVCSMYDLANRVFAMEETMKALARQGPL